MQKKDNELIRIEKEKMRLSSKKERNNPLVEIIPINEGCLNTCTFCKTKQARGQLFSYSVESIKESMKKALDETNIPGKVFIVKNKYRKCAV